MGSLLAARWLCPGGFFHAPTPNLLSTQTTLSALPGSRSVVNVSNIVGSGFPPLRGLPPRGSALAPTPPRCSSILSPSPTSWPRWSRSGTPPPPSFASSPPSITAPARWSCVSWRGESQGSAGRLGRPLYIPASNTENRLRVALGVQRDELLGQSLRAVFSRLTLKIALRSSVTSPIALWPARGERARCAGNTPRTAATRPQAARRPRRGSLYALVVVAHDQSNPLQAPVQETSKERRGVSCALLPSSHFFHGQDLPKALLVHPNAGHKRQGGDARAPPDLRR